MRSESRRLHYRSELSLVFSEVHSFYDIAVGTERLVFTLMPETYNRSVYLVVTDGPSLTPPIAINVINLDCSKVFIVPTRHTLSSENSNGLVSQCSALPSACFKYSLNVLLPAFTSLFSNLFGAALQAQSFSGKNCFSMLLIPFLVLSQKSLAIVAVIISEVDLLAKHIPHFNMLT